MASEGQIRRAIRRLADKRDALWVSYLTAGVDLYTDEDADRYVRYARAIDRLSVRAK